MVNVDDLNDAIVAFGNITNRFDEVKRSCEKLEDISSRIEKNTEKNEAFMKTMEEYKSSVVALENGINRKVEYTETNIKDKISFSQAEVINTTSKAKDELQSSLYSECKNINDQCNEIKVGIVTLDASVKENFAKLESLCTDIQKKRMITWGGIGVVIVLEIVRFFVQRNVLYRVTLVYEGDNKVASGVQMEAYSVEDAGKGICFNVYCYNVQPGISINYATGKNELIDEIYDSAKALPFAVSNPSDDNPDLIYEMNKHLEVLFGDKKV